MTQFYASLPGVKLRLFNSTAVHPQDAVLVPIITAVNGWMEMRMGRSVGSTTVTTMTFDGYDAVERGRCMIVPQGVQSLSLLEVGAFTGDAFVTVPATDYFIAPNVQAREPGWPGFEVWMTDIPSAANSLPVFLRGYQNVRMTGAFQWAATPPELIQVGEVAAVRAWQARQSGQSDSTGSNELGEPLVSRYISGEDRNIVDHYRWRPVFLDG